MILPSPAVLLTIVQLLGLLTGKWLEFLAGRQLEKFTIGSEIPNERISRMPDGGKSPGFDVLEGSLRCTRGLEE